MFPDILANENISSSIILSLKKENFNVVSIKDDYRGIKDIDIIGLAAERNLLILTVDSDFGEWVFSHKIKSTGILYLRYEQSQKNEIIIALITVLKKYSISLYQKFTAITPNKIRIRDI